MHNLVFLDVECYSNYFLICFKSKNKTKMIEMHNNSVLNRDSICNIMSKYTTVGFNSNNYDLFMIAHAISLSSTNESLKRLSDALVKNDYSVKHTLRDTVYKWNHIDLFNIAPKLDTDFKVGLKVYGARLGTKLLQDLPIPIDSIIQKNDTEIIQKYCENDVNVTMELHNVCKPAIDLRVEMGSTYQMDLRSSSDAQIAEKIVKNIFKDKRENTIQKPFFWRKFDYLKFKSKEILDWIDVLEDLEFSCDDRTVVKDVKNKSYGSLLKDKRASKQFKMGNTTISVGMGGMHSINKAEAYISTENEYIIDVDFSSYYPAIIISNNMYPENLGLKFLNFFKTIYKRRKSLCKTTQESKTYKIVLNGSCGKTNSYWSCMYDPKIFINMTLTGQLTCLMLIEKLVDMGCSVISANTDGVTFKGTRAQLELHKQILRDWAANIELEIDIVEYKAIYHETVNSYIALKPDNSVKGKGTFAEGSLSKTPNASICADATVALLKDNIPIRQTILDNLHNINKFVVVKKVTSGGYYNGDYLGKTVRWYYGNDDNKFISTKKGHKVATSDGATPVMNFDKQNYDINVDKYVDKTQELLKRIGI